MYQINPIHNQHIISYKHNGSISLEELRSAWMELLDMEEFSKREYHILADYRGGDFEFEMLETEVIFDFLINIRDLLAGKKEAVIVDNPKNTVLSLLLQNKIDKDIDFKVKLFSTPEAAERWLLI